jgi:hypothetical protein
LKEDCDKQEDKDGKNILDGSHGVRLVKAG